MKKLVTLITSIFFLGAIFMLLKPVNKVKKLGETSPKKQKSKSRAPKLNRRQMDIMDLLNNKGKVAMKNIERKFTKVNVRTLRRDLEKLQKLELIQKEGSTKASTYKKL